MKLGAKFQKWSTIPYVVNHHSTSDPSFLRLTQELTFEPQIHVCWYNCARSDWFLFWNLLLQSLMRCRFLWNKHVFDVWYCLRKKRLKGFIVKIHGGFWIFFISVLLLLSSRGKTGMNPAFAILCTHVWNRLIQTFSKCQSKKIVFFSIFLQTINKGEVLENCAMSGIMTYGFRHGLFDLLNMTSKTRWNFISQETWL